ncbi:MAG: SpoIIE family protein phosphatase [bacterium]
MRRLARRGRIVTAVVFLLLGPALGLFMYWTAAREEEARVASGFDEYLTEQVFAFEREIFFGIEALHSLHSLFESSDEVTRKEFAAFARPALARHPSIQALEWIPRVPADEREALVNRARREGLSDFRICDFLGDGGMTESPLRDVHYPVYFVEPLDGNENVLGFDVGSEAIRRAALQRATESRQTTLTDPIVLVQEIGASYGVLGLKPIFAASNAADRADSEPPAGFILSVFRVQSVVQNSLLTSPDTMAPRMAFELVDPDVNGDSLVVYATAGFSGPDRPAQDIRQRRVTLGDQQWQLNAVPTTTFLAAYQRGRPLVVGVSVFLAWEMLCILLLALAKWSLDHAMRSQDRIMASVCRSLTEGVIVADRHGKLVLFNDAAESMLGRGVTDTSPENWSSAYGCYLPDKETLYPPEQLPLTRALRGEIVSEEDLFIRNPEAPDGVWININGSPLVDEKGNSRGGVIAFRNVTEKKQSDELSRVLLNALEETDDMVFVTDQRGVIEYVNPAFETTTGYAKHETIGQRPSILKSGEHDEAHYRELWSTILAGKIFRKLVTNRKKNGETFIADQTITPIKDDSGNVTRFVSVVKDLTEIQRMQRQEAEMDLASMVQRKLYPQASPSVDGYDIAGAVFPAEATCGDYFDYFEMQGGGLGVAIGDVSGHGVGPALLMAETRAFLRLLAQSHADLGEIFTWINSAVAADFEDFRYVTMSLVRFDLRDHHLEYVNAGHLPTYILDRKGNVKSTLDSTGLPLGMVGDFEYVTARHARLEPGEMMLFLTDGVTEGQAHNDIFLPTEDILELAKEYQHESAQKIVDRLYGAVHAFGNGQPQEDDITIIVCKMTDEAGTSIKRAAAARVDASARVARGG